MKTKKTYAAIFFLILLTPPCVYAQERYDLWDQYGNERNEWKTMSINQKTFALDKYKREIDYCVANIGQSCEVLDKGKIGKDMGYCAEVGYVTNGLIGWRYRGYRDFKKAAEYFEKDLKEWEKCKKQYGEKYGECWPGAVLGDASYVDVIIETLEFGNLYESALRYHQSGYPELIRHLAIYSDVNLLKNDFDEYKNKWPEFAKQYQDYMGEWERAKELAKTTKPKPLDPAVQHHEWFYSDKRSEVLKSLAYYHKHEVRFMLEKALEHKDPKMAAKAKKYLESLGKDDGPGK